MCAILQQEGEEQEHPGGRFGAEAGNWRQIRTKLGRPVQSGGGGDALRVQNSRFGGEHLT